MGSKRTTVEIDERFLPKWDRLVKRYGMKTVVSAGLELFDALDAREQIKLVDRINGVK